MSESEVLKCPKCECSDGIVVARDMKATRMCPECGHTWLPGKPKAVDTSCFIEDFNGNKMFSIWHVDSVGNKTKDYPLISFGKAKAIALLKFYEELKKYVEEN